MRVCCDTSFLFSFYGRDTFTPAALVVAQETVLYLSPFNEYEFLNAVRLGWVKFPVFQCVRHGMRVFPPLSSEKSAYPQGLFCRRWRGSWYRLALSTTRKPRLLRWRDGSM